MNTHEKPVPDPEREPNGPKEPRAEYSEPKVTAYGRVEDITKNVGLTTADGVIGSGIA